MAQSNKELKFLGKAQTFKERGLAVISSPPQHNAIIKTD
jgi:hypothetical protein